MRLMFTNRFQIAYVVAVLFTTSRRVVFSLPQGAPCEAIAYNNPDNSPRHLNHSAQLGSGPFAIDVYDGEVLIRDGVLIAGREYLVVIHGDPKGFLVRALNHEHFFGSKFKVLTDVGDFSTLGHSCAQKVDCREDGVFVTHNGNRCTNGPRIKIKYTPPIPDTGVVFRLNAVQDFSTFYNDIRTQKYTVIANPSESEPIIPSSFSLAKPFRLPDENADGEVDCKGDFSQPQQQPYTLPKGFTTVKGTADRPAPPGGFDSSYAPGRNGSSGSAPGNPSFSFPGKSYSLNEFAREFNVPLASIINTTGPDNQTQSSPRQRAIQPPQSNTSAGNPTQVNGSPSSPNNPSPSASRGTSTSTQRSQSSGSSANRPSFENNNKGSSNNDKTPSLNPYRISGTAPKFVSQSKEKQLANQHLLPGGFFAHERSVELANLQRLRGSRSSSTSSRYDKLLSSKINRLKIVSSHELGTNSIHKPQISALKLPNTTTKYNSNLDKDSKILSKSYTRYPPITLRNKNRQSESAKKLIVGSVSRAQTYFPNQLGIKNLIHAANEQRQAAIVGLRRSNFQRRSAGSKSNSRNPSQNQQNPVGLRPVLNQNRQPASFVTPANFQNQSNSVQRPTPFQHPEPSANQQRLNSQNSKNQAIAPIAPIAPNSQNRINQHDAATTPRIGASVNPNNPTHIFLNSSSNYSKRGTAPKPSPIPVNGSFSAVKLPSYKLENGASFNYPDSKPRLIEPNGRPPVDKKPGGFAIPSNSLKLSKGPPSALVSTGNPNRAANRRFPGLNVNSKQINSTSIPNTNNKEIPQQPNPIFRNNRGPNPQNKFSIDPNSPPENPQSLSNENDDQDHINNGGLPNGHKLPGTAPRPSFNELDTGFENAQSGFDRIVQPQPQPVNLILPGGSEINLGSIPIKSNSQNSDNRGTASFGRSSSQASVAVGKAEVSKLSSLRTSHQPTRTSGPVLANNLAVNPNWNVPSFRTTQFKRRGTVDELSLTAAGLATAADQCEGRADDFPAICDRMRRMDPSACHPSKAMAGRCMASCCSILKFMEQQISKGLPANPLLYNQPQG